jgi:hypothetical protein
MRTISLALGVVALLVPAIASAQIRGQGVLEKTVTLSGGLKGLVGAGARSCGSEPGLGSHGTYVVWRTARAGPIVGTLGGAA